MTRRNWTAIAKAHELEEYRERAADVDYPQDRPEAPMTDPHIMAAQIRAWANVVQRLAQAFREDDENNHARSVAVDLAKQMRDVAQREER